MRTTEPSEAFDALVGTFSLDSIVNAVAGLSRARMAEIGDWDQKVLNAGVHPAALGWFLLRRLVTEAIVRRPLPDTATDVVDARWLMVATEALMDMGAKADSELLDDTQERWARARRMLQAQYHDQLDHRFYLRELCLAMEVIDSLRVRNVDLEAAYLDALGITFSDFAVLSLAAHATIAGEDSTGLLDRNSWTGASTVRIDPNRVAAYFAVTVGTYRAVQDRITNDRTSAVGYEYHVPSPLLRTPLIERGDGLLAAPLVRDVLERPTRQFLTEAPLLLCASDRGRFGQAVGEVYERYAKEALGAVVGKEDVLDGKRVFPKDSKQCDFAVEEGQLLTLCEVKGIRFAPRADLLKRLDVLRAELTSERGVAHGLLQINESALAIRNRQTDFDRRRILAGLLVVRGEQVMLNDHDIRQILEEYVEDESGRNIIVKYQLVNDLAFERVIQAAAAGMSIGKYIQEKCDDKRRKHVEVFADLRDRYPLGPHPLVGKHDAALDALLNGYRSLPSWA
ncbi:MAG: hypothetical protein ACR2HN_11715 [Tepidiformaceae bacterium]